MSGDFDQDDSSEVLEGSKREGRRCRQVPKGDEKAAEPRVASDRGFAAQP